MHEAGNGKHIAEKYKNKGLRVIAVDRDGRKHAGSEAKWSAAGANFHLYNRNNNCFATFYRDISGYPSYVCVKEWQKNTITGTESEIKNIFGF